MLRHRSHLTNNAIHFVGIQMQERPFDSTIGRFAATITTCNCIQEDERTSDQWAAVVAQTQPDGGTLLVDVILIER